MNSKLYVTGITLLIAGCAHNSSFEPNLDIAQKIKNITDSYPLVPQKDSAQEIKNIHITYILPNDIAKQPGTFNGLTFQEYVKGGDAKREVLNFKPMVNGVQVERRTDNGVAGSGLIYTIDANITAKANATEITLTPRSQKSYQQGLVLPFPIPIFDIESYLSDIEVSYKFELDSEYPPSSIEGNFKRILGAFSTNKNVYRLDCEDGEFIIKTEIYPYKGNKSKVSINAIIVIKKSKNRVIDIVRKVDELKDRIRHVINS